MTETLVCESEKLDSNAVSAANTALKSVISLSWVSLTLPIPESQFIHLWKEHWKKNIKCSTRLFLLLIFSDSRI